MTKTIFRWLAAWLFVLAGLIHFRYPGMYLSIMPRYLPRPLELVYVSGVAEILGGIGLLFPMTRRFSAWGLMALLVAVLPANLQMALDGFRTVPGWVLWSRLPFQAVFMAWVYWVGIARTRAEKLAA